MAALPGRGLQPVVVQAKETPCGEASGEAKARHVCPQCDVAARDTPPPPPPRPPPPPPPPPPHAGVAAPAGTLAHSAVPRCPVTAAMTSWAPVWSALSAGRVPLPSPGLQADELALLVGPPATFWLCVWCV
jgi:hypothetical protein